MLRRWQSGRSRKRESLSISSFVLHRRSDKALERSLSEACQCRDRRPEPRRRYLADLLRRFGLLRRREKVRPQARRHQGCPQDLQAVSLHSLTGFQSHEMAALTGGRDGRLAVAPHHFFSGSDGAFFSRSLGRLSPIMLLYWSINSLICFIMPIIPSRRSCIMPPPPIIPPRSPCIMPPSPIMPPWRPCIMSHCSFLIIPPRSPCIMPPSA